MVLPVAIGLVARLGLAVVLVASCSGDDSTEETAAGTQSSAPPASATEAAATDPPASATVPETDPPAPATEVPATDPPATEASTSTSTTAALDPTTTTAPLPAVGVETESAGIFVTVLGTRRIGAVDFCAGVERANFCESFDPAAADVIYVDTVVRNESVQGLDLTCGYPIDHALIDGRGRELASTGALYEIVGNPGCNDQLNPGFSVNMTYAYPIPTGASFNAWRYRNVDIENAPDITINIAPPSQPPTTTSPIGSVSTEAPAPPAVGVESESAGIFVTVLGTRRIGAVDFCAVVERADFCQLIDPAAADVIYVDTVVRNESMRPLDLTCGYPIDHVLIDGSGRELEDTGALYEIVENPGCNDQLNPGFSVNMTYVYPIPTGAPFNAWRYRNVDVDDAPDITIKLA